MKPMFSKVFLSLQSLNSSIKFVHAVRRGRGNEDCEILLSVQREGPESLLYLAGPKTAHAVMNAKIM